MNLASELLSAGAPDGVAIQSGSNAVTYRELRDKVDSVARLLGRNLTKQDRVAIWAENSIFFAIAYLAAIRAGMVAVPIPIDSPPDAADRILKDAGVSMILVSTRCAAQASHSANAGVTTLTEAELSEPLPSIENSLPDVDPRRDLAALMFTSGSTGTPKGVMVTHANIECNTRDIVSYLGLSSADRALVVLPFSYCFGLSVLHTHLAVGGSVVISNQFMYPHRMLEEINDRACTGFAGVPSTFQVLLRRSQFAQLAFPSLRWLQQAGGRLPNSSIQEIINAFPSVRFYVMYGQTEGTARLSCLPPERLRDKLGSIGMGLPSTRLEVLRGDGLPVTPGTEEIGEITASGDNVALGYWNDPQETAKYFRDGRLYTGDLARVDADGFIFVVDRERDMIKCAGNRVSAREVEDAIAELPDVAEVAVVGAAHDILGEAIVAFVSASAAGGQTLDVQDHCRRRLPASRIPEVVVHLAELPHNGSGKIMKARLRRLAAGILSTSSGEAFADRQPDDELLRPLRIDRRA